MDMIIALAYLAAMIVLLVSVGRRTATYVRQVPPPPLGAPDTHVLRRRFVRVVFGLALLTGLAKLIVDAPAPGFSRDVLWMWPWVAAATVAAACIAPLVIRRAHGDAWPTSSTVLPVVGLSLVLPITLHAIVSALARQPWTAFDHWCGASAVGAAAAHAVFAILFGARSLSLARTGESAISRSDVYTLAVLAGGFPFFIFGMALTAATGVVVLPVICLVDWLARREHAALSSGLPRAIVAPCRG